MSEISKVILPTSKSQYENDLNNALEAFINSISLILDRGISFFDNVDCVLVTFTSSATPDAENTISHLLGKIPSGFIVYSQDKAGSFYDGSTAFTASNIYVKCDTASVTAKIIIF